MTPGRPFRPWLAAIARYKWVERLRAMRREGTDVLDDDLGVEGHQSRVTSAIVLEDLLGRLKPAQALAIRLVRLQGFSIEEAAEARASPNRSSGSTSTAGSANFRPW